MGLALSNEQLSWIVAHKGIISASEMAEKFGVSVRTIFRVFSTGGVNLRLEKENRKKKFILQNWKDMTVNQMADQLNCSTRTIFRLMDVLGLEKVKKTPASEYTTEEELEVLQYYGVLKISDLANRIGKTVSSVVAKAEELGIRGRVSKWTDEEVQILKSTYNGSNAAELADLLGRSHGAILQAAQIYGVAREMPRYDSFDRSYIERHLGSQSTSEIADMLSRSKEAVETKAMRLGFKKEDFQVKPRPTLSIASHTNIQNMRRATAKIKVKAYSGRVTSKSSSRWSSEDDALILTSNLSNAELALKLDRSEGAVAARKCKLKKK